MADKSPLIITDRRVFFCTRGFFKAFSPIAYHSHLIDGLYPGHMKAYLFSLK